MDAFLLYIFKSSAVLSLFYIVYELFLKNESIFTTNRWFLNSGILLSFIIPIITITQTIWVKKVTLTTISPITKLVDSSGIIIQNSPFSITKTPINWLLIFFSIYVIGLLFFTLKLGMQLISIRKYLTKKEVQKVNGFLIIEVDEKTPPFSFFKTIVFTKNTYSREEENIILTHEKIHGKQYHSIDILFSNVLIILQWFNPIAWVYKKNIQQNLEYITDNETLNSNITLKEYQNTLLKTIFNQNNTNSLTTNFNQSLIKKRIIMLNKKTTSKKAWKMLFIAPLIISFIFSCNTETITKTKEIAEIENIRVSDSLFFTPNKNTRLRFTPPIEENDLVKKAAGYGMRINPISKLKKMHNGIDYKAPIGTSIYPTAKGTITIAKYNAKLGNHITIKHIDGYESKYIHLSKILVKVGDRVLAKDVIGLSGNTGLSTGPHLHFEILKNNLNIDPTPLVPFTIKTKHPLFSISKTSSNNSITSIENYFKAKFKNTQIKFEDIIRDQYNQITGFTLLSKMGNQTNFKKEFTINKEYAILDYLIIPKDENIFWIASNNVFTKHTPTKTELMVLK